jgi:hypothetical protein
MDTLTRAGIIDFAHAKLQHNRKNLKFRSRTMTYVQLEGLIATLWQLVQKARSNGDSCEYYRLSEELRMAEAALKERVSSTSVSSSSLALI